MLKTILGSALLGAAGLALWPAAASAQVDYDCSSMKGAAIVHFQGPYTQQLIQGAQAAAEECGAAFQSGGPAMFDASATVSLFQDMVLSGANAIVVVPYPAEFWIRIIDDAVKQGVSVSTFDVPSPASLQSVHTAPKQDDLGRSMAEVLAQKLGPDAHGQVIDGLCIPGLDVLEARVTGFKEEMAEREPNVEIVGPIDVSFDQTENFSRWKNLVENNPDALAHVGFCENDLPSLVRIKESDPNPDYEIASIGVNPEGLQGIKDGLALAAIGQKPFMQGYVAMRTMLESRAKGTDVPRGWIDVRPEVITADNVDAVMTREASLANGTDETKAFYQPEIDAIFSDLAGHVQSFGDLLGN